MKVKEVKPINFLFFRTRTTLGELEQFLPVGQRLYKAAVENGLPITGPVHWHYYNFTGDPKSPFDLEIALPVGILPPDYDGEFHIKRTQAFKCVSTFHEGDWYSIPQTYNRIMEFISKGKLTPATGSREIYVNVDLQDSSANVTEIQFGVA